MRTHKQQRVHHSHFKVSLYKQSAAMKEHTKTTLTVTKNEYQLSHTEMDSQCNKLVKVVGQHQPPEVLSTNFN